MYAQRKLREPWFVAFDDCQCRAKKKGLVFSITREWARIRYTGKCELTGVSFAASAGHGPKALSISIDQIVPRGGYTPENSRFILHAINSFKGQMADEEMLALARALLTKS